MFFIPFSVLTSDGAWLLFPALMFAGATQLVVYLVTSIGRIIHPLVMVATLVLVFHLGWAILTGDPQLTLGISLLALAVVSILSWAWLRYERDAGLGKTTV